MYLVFALPPPRWDDVTAPKTKGPTQSILGTVRHYWRREKLRLSPFCVVPTLNRVLKYFCAAPDSYTGYIQHWFCICTIRQRTHILFCCFITVVFIKCKYRWDSQRVCRASIWTSPLLSRNDKRRAERCSMPAIAWIAFHHHPAPAARLVWGLHCHRCTANAL
jgi:hypothetical protein